MAKKYFLIVDTETTQTSMVADFGAIVCDKKGNIAAQCGVLVREFYLDRTNHPLFYTKDADPLWGLATLDKRYQRYNNMLENGTRMLASVPAINKWLTRAMLSYKPVLTAYNLPFDRNKCENSAIDLDMFPESFCLYAAAAQKWGHVKKFREFVLEHHLFNKPTKLGNMTYQRKAETMARFLLGAHLPDEPHTALEDARDYEMPILTRLVKNAKVGEYMNAPHPGWRDVQVRDWFKAK